MENKTEIINNDSQPIIKLKSQYQKPKKRHKSDII